MKDLTAKDHAEAVATFRYAVIGPVCARDLSHGDSVRKLLRQHGLERIAVRDALWHGDVCHGPTLRFSGVRTPLRIHSLLDDCSRYVVALEAHASEREEGMLRVLTRALRLHGRSDVLADARVLEARCPTASEQSGCGLQIREILRSAEGMWNDQHALRERRRCLWLARARCRHDV